MVTNLALVQLYTPVVSCSVVLPIVGTKRTVICAEAAMVKTQSISNDTRLMIFATCCVVLASAADVLVERTIRLSRARAFQILLFVVVLYTVSEYP